MSCNNERIQSNYTQKIITTRAFFDASFYGANSVLEQSEIKHFNGLDFFKVDSSYRVIAKSEKLTNQEPQFLHSNTNNVNKFEAKFNLTFSINNTACNLTAYQSKPSITNTYFIPFTDQTSGKTTYGGGRFLDVTIIGGLVIIDFNLAYNPTCAYNSKYNCPSPPQENHLLLNILAGERIPLIENHE